MVGFALDEIRTARDRRNTGRHGVVVGRWFLLPVLVIGGGHLGVGVWVVNQQRPGEVDMEAYWTC